MIKKGFTLIELVITVAIVCIILSIFMSPRCQQKLKSSKVEIMKGVK